MKKQTPAATRSNNLSAFLKGFRDQSISREHYYYNGRPLLSHKAKYLLKLLKGQLPKDVMKHLEYELASETRRDQNVLAQELFNILIDSAQFSEPEDEPLSLKLDELASVVCAHLNLNASLDWM